MATKKAAKKSTAKKEVGLTLEERVERLERHQDNVAEYMTQHGIHIPDPDTLHETLEQAREDAELSDDVDDE